MTFDGRWILKDNDNEWDQEALKSLPKPKNTPTYYD